MTRSRAQAGMTLIEVSVVLAIIGVLAAIAVPSMQGALPRMRLSNDVSNLANEISLSRVRAITKSSRFRVTFSPSTDSYFLERETGGAWVRMNSTRTAGTDLVSATNFRDADMVIADINGSMSVAFNNQGVVLLSTPGGQIQKRIKVEPIGRVFVERKGLDGTWVKE